MKKNKGIARSLMLVSQVGISMMMPVFLGLAAGIFIDKRVGGRFLTIVFLILGLLAGVRNAYMLLLSNIKMDLDNNKKNENAKIQEKVNEVIHGKKK